jgi:hypothetical protein
MKNNISYDCTLTVKLKSAQIDINANITYQQFHKERKTWRNPQTDIAMQSVWMKASYV